MFDAGETAVEQHIPFCRKRGHSFVSTKQLLDPLNGNGLRLVI